jgi:uncharacterized lipoprotein
MRKLSLFLLLGFLSACTTTSSAIAPKASVSPTDHGGGWKVFLQVKDPHAAKNFDQRAWGEGEDRIETSAIASAITSGAEKALTALGFTPSTDDDSAFRSLTIEIRDLNYAAKPSHVLAVDLTANTEIFISASRRGQKFERSYTQNISRTVPIKPNKKKNEALLEDLFSGTLTMIFQDQQLLNFLAHEQE